MCLEPLGHLRCDCTSPSGACAALANGSVNAWEAWTVERNGVHVRLDDLRDTHLETVADSESVPP